MISPTPLFGSFFGNLRNIKGEKSFLETGKGENAIITVNEAKFAPPYFVFLLHCDTPYIKVIFDHERETEREGNEGK